MHPIIMNEGPSHYNVIMEDFSGKVRRKVAGEIALCNHAADLRNETGQTLVDFTENL